MEPNWKVYFLILGLVSFIFKALETGSFHLRMPTSVSVAMYHDTYRRQKVRETYLIYLPVKLGDQQERLPIRSTASVKNEENPPEISTIGSYEYTPISLTNDLKM